MSGFGGQKERLLFLRNYLLKKTDENHPVTMPELLDLLARAGFSAERKAVYEDIYALRDSGMDIIAKKGRNSCYYVGSRDFELAELKLLVDSVQSSKFITGRKTGTLTRKIEALASEYEAQQLDRQMIVRNRVKSMNESVFYSVDAISTAISQDHCISFQYADFTVRKERFLRHKGALYTVSPFALVWDDENYYLIAFDHANREIRHYRVDKMVSITEERKARQGKEEFRKEDMSSYTSKTFGMFSGETVRVQIRFENSLAGAVIDRFGSDAYMSIDGDGHFILSAEVNLSPVFYAWVFEFGSKAEILSPEPARRGMKEMLASVFRSYNMEKSD